MNSIQGLRAEALAAGNLIDTPQQQVVQEETVIRIVPAEPDVIYVPQYDPEVVYVQPYSPDFGPLLTFGAGLPWDHGSTTIAIGVGALCVWAIGVRDGSMTRNVSIYRLPGVKYRLVRDPGSAFETQDSKKSC